MSYITDILLKDERIVYKAATSRIAYLNALAVFAVMMQPTNMIRLARTQLALTNQRIIGTTGVVGRKTIAVPFAKVESVTVQTGLLGWALDYGNITVTAKDGNRVTFKGILWPLVFQQEAEEAIEIAVLGRKLSDFAPPPF